MKNYTNATALEKFNHCYEIWCKRKDLGMYTFGTNDVPNHPLIGQRVKNSKGTESTIQRVYVQYAWGMYRLSILFMDDNGSHGTRNIGQWKQVFDMDSIMSKARSITNTEYVKFFDDEEDENATEN